ncbi:ABC transporter substrate-binding protein [Pseudonocardia kunmingensis]|nr:ABC transporter substrate-binding protein [Pseudonocardia kunmingensis]
MRRLLALLATALVVVMLSACGGDGGEPADAAPGTAESEIDPNATLRYAGQVGIPDLDPHRARSEVLSFSYGLGMVYDRLFTVTADGKTEGMLVTDWELSMDGTIMSMNLREDVTFRDGAPVDAAAVKVNLDRARTLETPVVKAQMAAVQEVLVTGPYQVQLQLSRPTPAMPYVLAMMSGYIMHPALIANGDPRTEANGSGPYAVESFVPTKSLTLVRDGNYWDPEAAKLARIEYTTIGDPQAFLNALRGGQVDIGQMQPGEASGLDTVPGINIVRVPHGIGVSLYLNYGREPLDDIRVRQAINYAYNREAITGALLPGSVPAYQHYREGLPGYDPELEKSYEYDPAEARRLLTEAGYPGGIDLGEVMISQALPSPIGDVMQEQLSEAGIRIQPVVVDSVAIFQQWASGQYSGQISFNGTGSEPGLGAVHRWKTPSSNPAPTTPEFEEMLTAASDSRLTDTERIARYEELNGYLVEQAWAAPISWLNFPWVMSDRVQGFSAENDYATTIGPYDFRYLSMTAED